MPLMDVNQIKLHYRFDGPHDGSVVMLSHSLSSNLSMWDRQVPVLVDAGYRVLRYDSRGHGESGIPEGPYSMEMLTADAAGLMDALSLDSVHFCGLSMGGMVGQMMGVLHAGRLRSLMLCSTAAYMGFPEIWDERIDTVRQKGMAAVADATIDRWFTADGQKRLPVEIETVRRMIVNTPVEGFCACGRAIQNMDQRESIGAITTPTMVVVGEHDPGTPVSAAEFIHSKIAKSTLKVVPDAAHFLHVEQSHEFNDTLIRFLRTKG
jgi:3-oxoadipate enol-lactonase